MKARDYIAGKRLGKRRGNPSTKRRRLADTLREVEILIGRLGTLREARDLDRWARQ